MHKGTKAWEVKWLNHDYPLIFLPALGGLKNPSSLTRDQTWAPALEVESYPQDHQGIPMIILIKADAQIWASQVAQMVKNLRAVQDTWVWSLGWEDPLEKGMATHYSILAWRIPQTEDPGGLQSTGSQRVGHDWVTTTFRQSDARAPTPICYPTTL